MAIRLDELPCLCMTGGIERGSPGGTVRRRAAGALARRGGRPPAQDPPQPPRWAEPSDTTGGPLRSREDLAGSTVEAADERTVCPSRGLLDRPRE